MYTALLRTQWRSQSILLLLIVVISFALPTFQILGAPVALTEGRQGDALNLLGYLSGMSAMYPMAAYSIGAAAAVATWNDDFAGKHVYALSLPVPRWYYLLLRMSVGLTFVGACAAALWMASLVSLSQVQVPFGLHVYPTGMAVRYALTAAISFTMLFALASASQRVLRWVLWSVVAIIAMALIFGIADVRAPFEIAGKVLTRWTGFVDIFAGRWLLIDV